MNETLKILLVEDSPNDAKLLAIDLNKEFKTDIHTVDNETDYRKELSSFSPDIILSDYNLPSFNGMKALLIRQELHPTIPFILVTGSVNEETAVECIKAGADDYILKEHLNRLHAAIKSAIEKKFNIRAKEAAEERLHILSQSVEQSPISVIITNNEGAIEFVNPKFCDVTGYSYSEVIGKNPRFLKSGEKSKEEYAQLWATIKSGHTWTGEFHNKKKNGELYWESAVISPIVNNAGTITHFVAVKEDITEKKTMLEDLIAAKEKAEELSRLKTNFISNMSHELRTPLVGLLGISEFLIEELEGSQKENAELIHKSGLRLLKCITEILNFSNLETEAAKPEKVDIDVAKVISDEVIYHQNNAISKGIVIRQTILSNSAHIESDEKLFKGIIDNFLSNAIKFTDKGSVDVILSKSDRDVVIQIKDTGIGIPKEKQKQIFEEFRQISEGMSRKFEGIGIGLTLAKRYTDLLDGKIELDSKPGIGSTFTLRFPLSVSETKASEDKIEEKLFEKPSEVIAAPKKDYNVLIVEDDYINALTIKKMLEKKYNVFEAHNGPDAIEIAKKENLDIILMDINLKHSINGMETTQIIRQINGYADKPIVAMTAYAMQSDKDQFLKAGCSHYISKPFSLDDLLVLLNQISAGRISIN